MLQVEIYAETVELAEAALGCGRGEAFPGLEEVSPEKAPRRNTTPAR